METFYMRGNWEQGDRDGNGFVNQADADWLSARFTTLGVTLPDRLAFTGTFEKLGVSMGLNGRWQAERNVSNQLVETGNFNQRDPGYLAFAANGAGADKFSNTAVTIRQQNSAEAFDGLNTAARKMNTTPATPIDLAANEDTYLTFLVRQDTAGLTAAQLASQNRTLTLDLLTAGGQVAYDFAFFGQQTDFGIRSQADALGQDVTGDGFAAGATFLFVGKISGNGTDANKLQASLFAPGSTVGNFTDPDFQWMLSADGGAGYDPVITQLQLTSLFEANYTVSNVMVGSAVDFFGLPGDFDADGDVDGRDFLAWQRDPNVADLADWQNNYGMSSLAVVAAVPEPRGLALLIGLVFLRRRGRK
jgi:hypothetical protein